MEGLNMNFYPFINSPDIREHLAKIGYEFSSEEAAYLVWQSKETTIAEKHAAWEEIIRTMRACSFRYSAYDDSYVSDAELKYVFTSESRNSSTSCAKVFTSV